MNRLYRFFFCLPVLLISSVCLAQVSKDYAVLLTAEVDTITPKITLKWPPSTTATGYSIYKKAKSAAVWGTVYASPAVTDSTYIDSNVQLDTAYEYRIIRTAPGNNGYGYIYSGIKLHADDYKGKLILVVDSTYADSLSFELHRLMKDISGDGWAVVRHDVSPSDTVPDIKAIIVSEYNADPTNVKAVLLFGHVPVPYSGDLNPDGHPDHKGAWPADAYYADVNGNFTDVSINDTVASRLENRNIPGDGKFDQTSIPSPVELQVGRIDMYNLPAFAQDEKELLRRYLNKDHAFRQKLFTAQTRGLVDDNFGAFSGEAFAASGWKTFSPTVGDTNIHEIDFFTTLQVQNYLWAYGCGGGWYQGASGVGSSADFAADTVKSVFTMLFGSYFGDWDSQNNFLRSSLASKGNILSTCWSGRPHWYFHHMAMGENLGYAAKLVQNNTSTYVANYAAHWVHIALLGDPSLKMNIVGPPSILLLTPDVSGVILNWTASTDSVKGYYIYRSYDEFGKYERISPNIVNATTYLDGNPLNGTSFYMVRAVKLEQTPSGSYYNLSEGISDSIYINATAISQITKDELKAYIYPNPSDGQINISILNSRDKTEIIIYDLFGRIMAKKNIENSSSDFILPLLLNNLTNGVYVAVIKTDNAAVVRRFEIIR